ncbi:unnamed protein product [Brassica rapa subsp. narinosa]|uniref:1-phosphatidylinositol 4-kinase n=1 Tax=Brassica napus TaxID=3708 RepID=A0A817ASB7_BRANA|nr:unnamed protein product [Brassica napus]
MTLLDIRYGNTDRNQDNILNKEGKLIPIDHGECFPTEFDRYRPDWTVWKMAEIPYLTEMVEYVKTLDVDKDLEILRTNGIELGGRAVFVFRVQHMVLKLSVLGGNVPKDIGHLLTHPLRGGTSESLGTLFHKCMTHNPTDAFCSGLERNVYYAGKSRALVLVLPQRRRRYSMLSLRHKDLLLLLRIFLLPVQWVNKDIRVSGEVFVSQLKKVRQELQLGTGGN